MKNSKKKGVKTAFFLPFSIADSINLKIIFKMLKYDFKNETEKQKNEIKSNCFSNLKKLFSMLKKKPDGDFIKKNIENTKNKLKTLKNETD